MNTKKYMAALSIAAVVSITGTATSTAPVWAGPDGKVLVCKFVGTPGVDEVLKAGKNPIEVSVNAIAGSEERTPEQLIGAEFADGQDRSVVIAVVGQGPVPTSANCPAPKGPPTNTPGNPPTNTPGNPPTNTPGNPPTTTTPPQSQPEKVFVCKFVGTPGVDEVLQSGNNPIEVSVNAIPGNDGKTAEELIGFEFADGQGRSVVIAVSVTRGGGQADEPTIADCPAPVAPPVTPPVTTPVTPSVTPSVTPPVEVAGVTDNSGNNSSNSNGNNVDGSNGSNGNGNNGDGNGNNDDVEVMGQQASSGSQVKGQQNSTQSSAPGTTVAGEQQPAMVPTAVNAGASAQAAGNVFMLPGSLAALGALLGLVAFAARRRVS